MRITVAQIIGNHIAACAVTMHDTQYNAKSDQHLRYDWHPTVKRPITLPYVPPPREATKRTA